MMGSGKTLRGDVSVTFGFGVVGLSLTIYAEDPESLLTVSLTYFVEKLRSPSNVAVRQVLVLRVKHF